MRFNDENTGRWVTLLVAVGIVAILLGVVRGRAIAPRPMVVGSEVVPGSADGVDIASPGVVSDSTGSRGGSKLNDEVGLQEGDPATTTVMYDEGYPMGVDWSTEDADIVLEAQVEFVGPLRFNTLDGLLPILPTGPDGVWIYQPARLVAQRRFKGPESVTATWIPVWGGRLDGYAFERRPSHRILSGQRGVAFLAPVPAGPQSAPWHLHLAELADPPSTEPVRLLLNWYRFEDGSAISSADEQAMSIESLLSEIEAAIP